MYFLIFFHCRYKLKVSVSLSLSLYCHAYYTDKKRSASLIPEVCVPTQWVCSLNIPLKLHTKAGRVTLNMRLRIPCHFHNPQNQCLRAAPTAPIKPMSLDKLPYQSLVSCINHKVSH